MHVGEYNDSLIYKMYPKNHLGLLLQSYHIFIGILRKNSSIHKTKHLNLKTLSLFFLKEEVNNMNLKMKIKEHLLFCI